MILLISEMTFMQHLNDFKNTGIIQGIIDDLKIHYCLNNLKQNKITIIKSTIK